MSEIEFRVATEYGVVKVRMTKDGQERAERLRSEGKCLGCEQNISSNDRVTCGLCGTCYNGAITAINRKRITRRELIRDGKMLAPTKGGRPPVNKFTRELSGK